MSFRRSFASLQIHSSFGLVSSQFPLSAGRRCEAVAPPLLCGSAMVKIKTVGKLFGSIANRIRVVAIVCLATCCSAAWSGQNVSLAWNSSPDADVVAYTVHYGVASGVYSSSLNVGNHSSATVPGLQDGTTYYFVVSASNAAGLEGGPSNEVSFDSPAPGAQSATLCWNSSPDTSVTGYILHYGSASGVYDSSVNAGDHTTATVQGLQEGATYYFVATARNAAGAESGPSNEVAYQVGTGSHNVAPTLQLTSGTQPGDPTRFNFLSSPNQTYELQATEDFQTWTTIWQTLPSATSQVLEFADRDATASGMRFYRLMVR